MKILKLKDKEKSEFNKLALSYGTIFNSIEWSNLFNGRVNHYGIYDKGDKLIGGFMTYKENMFGLSFYRSPPFTPEMGPFLKIDASNPVSIMDIWKKSLSLMCNVLEKLPYAIISFPLSKDIADMQPFIWNKFKVVPAYTYIVDLSMQIDELWERMSSERRKNITKGMKDGLSVKKIDNFEVVRTLVLMTYSRQEKKTNEYYLNKVLFEFANENNSYAYATYKGDKAIACTFCIYDTKTAYYLMGGYDNKNKHHGAGAMSMWESIKYAQNKEIKFFDFEGSMNQNIERYFRGFGGQLIPYFTVNKAILPLEILLKLYKREQF